MSWKNLVNFSYFGSCPRSERFLDSGGGAPPKDLEAYRGEVVWPNPPEAEQQGLHGHWPNMGR